MKIEIIKTEKITYNETDNAVMDMVAEQLGANRTEINQATHFVDDLDADSLDQVELVMALEELLDCEVPDIHAERMLTVRDVLEYCEAQKLVI